MKHIPWRKRIRGITGPVETTTIRFDPEFKKAAMALAEEEGVSLKVLLQNLSTRNGNDFTEARKRLNRRVMTLGGKHYESSSNRRDLGR